MFIISVDSLSFGGAGKTPLVMAIGQALQERGARFAVISRGYRSRYEKTGLARREPANSARKSGDEPLMLKTRFPGPGSVHRPRPTALHRRGRRRE